MNTDNSPTPTPIVTDAPLTAESLAHARTLYKKLVPSLKKYSLLQEPGTYWVYESNSLSFETLHYYRLTSIQVSKVSTLKVGYTYRRDAVGWIVPDDLLPEFNQCVAAVRQHKELVRQSVLVASKLPRNGGEAIKALTPEKMRQFIELFS
jgi:hypothetical protein